MARQINYEEKIAGIKEKIEKKQEELKALKAELNKLENGYQDIKNKELVELMEAKGIDAARVMELINQNVTEE